MRNLMFLLMLTACAPTPADDWGLAADMLVDEATPPPGVYGFSLSVPYELVVGQVANFVVAGLRPGETVQLAVGTRGFGAGPCPPPLSGACPLDIVGPLRVIGSGVVDGAGAARIQVVVPAGLPAGRTGYFQAAVARGAGGVSSVKSNPASSTTVLTPTSLYDGRSAAWTGGFNTSAAVPFNAPVGVTWTGNELIIAHSAGSGPLSRFTNGGAPLGNFDPAGIIAPGDPAFDGVDVWINDEFDDQTYRVDLAGNILDAIGEPSSLTEFRIAHAWDGTSLWGAGSQNTENSMVFRYDANGRVVQAFEAPCNLFGLTVKDGNLWGLGSNYASVELCEMAMDGTPLGILPVAGITSLLQGIEWDGSVFWAGGNDPVDRRAVRIELVP